MEEDPLRRDLGKRKRAKKSESYDSIEDNIFDHGSLIKVDTEDAFLAYCQTQLLSYPVAADGLISQSDAAMFIQDICDIMDDEDLPDFQCPTPTFFNLNPEVQLSFVWFICPHDEQISLLQCLTDLAIQGTDFGYPVSASTLPQAEANVLGFCCSLLPFLDLTNITPLAGKYAVASVNETLLQRRISHELTDLTLS